MSFLHRLPSPYAGLDPVRDLSRLSADISYTDIRYLKHICPEKGLLNRMAQCFFASVAAEARHLNLNYYTPATANELQRIIADRCDFTRRCSTPPTDGSGHDPNEPGTTP